MADSSTQPGLAKRVAYNTTILFIGRILGAILAILSTRLIANALGVAGYGQFTTIFAYITFFGAIADFGFFWYLVREVAKNKDRTEEITANVTTLRLLFALVVLVIGSIVAYSIPSYDPVVRVGIVLLAASMLWVTMSNTLIGVFQANERMDFPVINEVIGRTATLLLTWYFVRAGYGLLPIVLAALAGSFIIFALNLVLVRRYTRIRLGFDTHMWKNIMRENLSLGINVLLGIIYFKIDAVILSALKPSLDVGIYGAPYKVAEILLAFPAMFMGVVFPALSQVIGKDKARTKEILQKAFDLLAIAGWGVTGGCFMLAQGIIMLTTKGESSFLTASTIQINGLAVTAPVVLQILSFAVGLAFLGNFFVSAVIAQGSQKNLIVSNVINAVANTGINFLLIPLFTYVAAAGMTIASEVIMLIFASIIVYQKTGFFPKLLVFFKAGLATLLMAFVLYFIRDHVHVIVATFVGGGVYLAALFVSGCLNRDLLNVLLRRSNAISTSA